MFLALLTFLSATTVFSALAYYKYLRRAQKEYEKAKAAVDDIVLSFNRQFRRTSDKLETIAYKVEMAASKTSSTLDITKNVEKRISEVEGKTQTEADKGITFASRLESLEKNAYDIIASQSAITLKITELERRANQPLMIPESTLEAVIPIRKEKAIAQLTDTELSALEMLAAQGPKTAPEIKEFIKLSREHTARLMKNLYEEGYLERETGKIPFKYSVKKEMEKFLKKTEGQAG